MHHLAAITQKHVTNSSDVNLLTQFSIVGDSCGSSISTSTQQLFVCQTNTNPNGNLLFPLTEKHENSAKDYQKLSRHDLLKHLKSQRIVKNIEIFNKLKRRQQHDRSTQQFPLEIEPRQKEQFPCQNVSQDVKILVTSIGLKRKEYKNVKKLEFPLKVNTGKGTFAYHIKGLKEIKENMLNVRSTKVHQLDPKIKQHLKLMHSLKKLPKHKVLKRFPSVKKLNGHDNRQFPSKHNPNSLYRTEKSFLKFPQKLFQNLASFPLKNNYENEKKFKFQNFELITKVPKSNATNSLREFDDKSITKFPCKISLKSELAVHSSLSKFPIHNEELKEIKNSNNSKTSFSLSMTHNSPTFKNINSEHVSQVQHAQVHVEENPRVLTAGENTQPPIVKTIYDEAVDVCILAAINSINNTRPKEVGYYAEKIELIQDAIVALFEKIQNSLTTNHNSETKSTNAVRHDHHYGDARFALTPPTSVTSVRNTERTHKNEYDLGDLRDRQVDQIVECSDVRDTLAEAVDHGVTKEQTNSTGNFLVKSEEPTSPNSPTPNPLNESTYTSIEDYTNTSELLPKYNVLAVSRENNVGVKNKLECDPNKLNEIRKTRENISDSVKVNEMTVTRLADNEQENTNEGNHLQSNEALEHKNNILSNVLQIDEMKFEMNRVKGALPSSGSERSLGKHENSHYGRHVGANSARLSTDTSLSHNRLPSSQSSTHNCNDSSYTPRSSLINDSSTIANTATKRSILNTSLPQDTVTKRSVLSTPALSETISNLSALNPLKDLNDPSSDVIPYRRPSLGTLRSTQSTSLLSMDLPRYSPLIIAKPTDKTTPVSRAISIDSSLEDVLPERTRLRRQRHLRTQNSQNEPEDPIERLNRLKARISASLSEVKGVLKQYSTETENENQAAATATATVAANSLQTTKEKENKEEGPVAFRFVKIVRRRSIFSEEDENEQKEKEKNKELSTEKTDNHAEKQLDSKDEVDNIRSAIGSTQPTQIPQIQEKQIDNKETNEVKVNKNLYTLKEEIQESLNESKPAKEQTKIEEEKENNKTVTDEVPTLKEEAKGAMPKPDPKHEADETTTTKTKKKLIIKSKDPARRASLAAVEGSKIEPPVKVAIPARIQRRPSDSEAVVKKQLITAKKNTSGAVEEVTPKPKIVKVKRSSIKSKNNSRLATTQSKLIEEDTTMTTSNDKSDDHVKSIDEGNKSIHTDANKDALMPKQRPQQQQQIKTKITSQTNLLLPTQLVIDEAASLNVKTIENSVLSSKQQREQKQENQATIISTTTNFKSNDLQSGGAMLEDLTTVLSSSTTSEANGQIKRENVQQDNFHDLLQQETAIIEASTANKQYKLKSQVNQVENNQSKVIDLLNENLENLQTSEGEQQQDQQVVETTDVVVVKSNDDDNNKNNKNEDVKANASLKVPCIDKTPTSPHISAERQLVEGEEQSITNVADTKTISSPHISISSTSDITEKTSESSTESVVEQKTDVSAQQQNTMPELQLTPAPVQTAEIISHPEHHKKNVILKKVVRQSSVEKSKKTELEITKPTQQEVEHVTVETPSEINKELTEECLESTEISESSTSLSSEEVTATETPKKERKVKKKVIIKRQKRRLSIGDSFFHPGAVEDPQNAEVETLEKPIAYVTDDEADQTDGDDEEASKAQEQQEEKKPLKSCIMQKEYHIGDEVLYAERFKKTQIKWRRGRIKERITSISYLLDIDGKDVSSHINYLKKFTGRKVSFGGKEYLEIDYEQLAEEEEKAERLQRRTYSIWNMV